MNGCLRWILLLLILSGACVDAGVVVFKNGGVVATTQQTVTGSEIAVTLPGGNATFLLDDVSWYSKDASITTLYGAAQAAQKEGKEDVALILAKESTIKEPATSSDARQLAFQLEDKLAAARPPSGASPGFEAAGGGGFTPAAGGTTAPKGGLDKMTPGAEQPAGGFAPPPSDSAQSSTPSAVDKLHGWAIEGSALSAEDLRANALVAGVFGLIVLFSLWKITISD